MTPCERGGGVVVALMLVLTANLIIYASLFIAMTLLG